MSFALQDVRVSSRRSRGGDVLLYPKVLRDSSILPKIRIAIEHFESMLGRERQSFDAEVLVEFFGDHKLARCVIACLGRAYRFRQPELRLAVCPPSYEHLREAELASSSALRFALYGHLNEEANGYLPQNGRADVFGRLERQYRLRSGELEPLLTLDDPERAVLVKVGERPRPPDVVAQYNAGELETLLRYASQIEIHLENADAETIRTIRALSASNGVNVDGDSSVLRLPGRQDALGSWARHGRRLVRTLVQAIEGTGRNIREASASIVWRGRPAVLRLTSEHLEMLGGGARTGTGVASVTGWDHACVDEAIRMSSGVKGFWGVRRMPEPQAWEAGVVVPDVLLRVDERHYHVVAVRSEGHATRLAPIAQAMNCGEPVVFTGHDAVLGPLLAVGARTVASPAFDLGRVVEAIGRS